MCIRDRDENLENLLSDPNFGRILEDGVYNSFLDRLVDELARIREAMEAANRLEASRFSFFEPMPGQYIQAFNPALYSAGESLFAIRLAKSGAHNVYHLEFPGQAYPGSGHVSIEFSNLELDWDDSTNKFLSVSSILRGLFFDIARKRVGGTTGYVDAAGMHATNRYGTRINGVWTQLRESDPTSAIPTVTPAFETELGQAISGTWRRIGLFLRTWDGFPSLLYSPDVVPSSMDRTFLYLDNTVRTGPRVDINSYTQSDMVYAGVITVTDGVPSWNDNSSYVDYTEDELVELLGYTTLINLTVSFDNFIYGSTLPPVRKYSLYLFGDDGAQIPEFVGQLGESMVFDVNLGGESTGKHLFIRLSVDRLSEVSGKASLYGLVDFGLD